MSATRSIIMSLTLVSACTSSTPEDEITKDEARQLGGKSDDGTDYCALFGWYGDGICDDFCPNPDPDCGPTGAFCGGFIGAICPEGQFCSFDEGDFCGFADAGGVCQDRPEAC